MPVCVGDGAREAADLLDFHTYEITRLKKDLRLAEDADAAGRAGDDDVAGIQRDLRADDRDQLRDAEQQVRCAAVLHLEWATGVRAGGRGSPGADRQPAAVAQLIGRDQHRAQRQERVRTLCPEPLPVALLAGAERARLTLPVAGGDVVRGGVAGDVREGVGDGDARRAPPDDHCQLGFQIQGVGSGRMADRICVRGHGVGEHREEDRPRGPLQALLADVVQVVVADTDDLARTGDRGQQPDVAGGE